MCVTIQLRVLAILTLFAVSGSLCFAVVNVPSRRANAVSLSAAELKARFGADTNPKTCQPLTKCTPDPNLPNLTCATSSPANCQFVGQLCTNPQQQLTWYYPEECKDGAGKYACTVNWTANAWCNSIRYCYCAKDGVKWTCNAGQWYDKCELLWNTDSNNCFWLNCPQ